MKVVIQRVKSSSVSVDGEVKNSIETGLMVLVGFTESDDEENINYMAKKIANLRIFNDNNAVMNKSILDVNGSILVISQFTLYADIKKGNCPSYVQVASFDKANVLYNLFVKELNKYVMTKTGVFGADMQVSLVNDGPVTILLEN